MFTAKASWGQSLVSKIKHSCCKFCIKYSYQHVNKEIKKMKRKYPRNYIFSIFRACLDPCVETHPLPLRIIYLPILRAWDSSRITRTKGIAMGEEGKVFLSPLRRTESFPFASEVNGKFSVRLLEGQLSHCSMSY